MKKLMVKMTKVYSVLTVQTNKKKKTDLKMKDLSLVIIKPWA